MEINNTLFIYLEFGAILVDIQRKAILNSEYHEYVCPIRGLSSQGRRFLGISDQKVRNGSNASICLQKFASWLKSLNIIIGENTVFGSWSSADQRILRLEIEDKCLPVPTWYKEYYFVDIQAIYSKVRIKRCLYIFELLVNSVICVFLSEISLQPKKSS